MHLQGKKQEIRLPECEKNNYAILTSSAIKSSPTTLNKVPIKRVSASRCRCFSFQSERRRRCGESSVDRSELILMPSEGDEQAVINLKKEPGKSRHFNCALKEFHHLAAAIFSMFVLRERNRGTHNHCHTVLQSLLFLKNDRTELLESNRCV